MQKKSGKVYFSASDLANFLDCEYLTILDRQNLDTPMPRAEDAEDAILIQQKGYAHEAAYLAALKQKYGNVVDISETDDGNDPVAATLAAMHAGADIIYQASFAHGNLIGYADFLRRVERPSDLGSYSYEVIDTKLSRTTQARFIVQLCFYSHLLAIAQGIKPEEMHVVLGDMSEKSYACSDYSAYFNLLMRRFMEHVEGGHADDLYPDPCAHCDLCHWRDRCAQQRVEDDHLCQVAGILKSQIAKLKDAGITTMARLAELPEESAIPRLNPASLQRIRHQAVLQHHQRTTGEAKVDLLPLDPDGKRGFHRLPRPDDGDLYFDMEGNPLEEGGNLEYLFGLYYLEQGEPVFKPFWALARHDEKRAFEQFMDFVTAHLEQHPDAHIYHYAAYEQTALKRLMAFYGTREAAVDNLLREGKLVDLYKVVSEAMRTSESGYSIKNIEHFYLDKRAGEVTNAGASIIYFEKWKATQDEKYLHDIALYNEDDVRSTMALHRWLLDQRPAGLAWANTYLHAEKDSEPEGGETPASALREQQLERYRRLLLGNAEIPDTEKTPEYHLNELIFQLMDFHRREAKPGWWDYYQRQEKTDEELIEDAEAIGGLVLDPSAPPAVEKRSIRYSFTYPAQETKLHAGSKPVVVETGRSVSNFEIDPDARRLSFTLGQKAELPGKVALGPAKPIESRVLEDAIQRFVDARLAGNGSYRAVSSLLAREYPRISGRTGGTPVIQEGMPVTDGAIAAISALDQSYLVVQGPPGTGKTYTGSKVIVELLRQGKSVGIASNSHKAINNLLLGVDREAVAQGFHFDGVKKSTGSDNELEDCLNIQICDSNEEALSGEFQLVAGTAWLFARAEADQSLDYLFIDEAGQVSLANLVAMGTAARNLVLLGDQMQLGQPIQGVHPGDSGLSALDFLLQEHHTVPPERGIFLGESHRMHPAVCRFISETVYDGRLKAAPGTKNQVLDLDPYAHEVLRDSGLVYVPVSHTGCTQSSDEEAWLVRELVDSLLEQCFIDKHGATHDFSLHDILVVTPYNLQVQKLKSLLPEGARVGTVDKFQGQEAPVVIFSMVTSSGDDLPRDIEFLYSKNRLNVAISRAQSLAIFIANPQLMHIRCNSPEQMKMVNTLCLVAEYGSKN